MNINTLEDKLVILAKDLNKSNVSWALGASYLLYLEGYDTTVQDIDIIIDEKDHKKLQTILQNYSYTILKSSGIYATEYFYSVTIDEVEFDLMINFSIQTEKEIYLFPFEVMRTISLQDTIINLGSVDEWLKAYTKMNRSNKVGLIKNGIKKV